MTIEVDFSAVTLPESLIWKFGSDGSKETTATATVMALESVAIGMPTLTADNAQKFLLRSSQLSIARGGGPWVLRKNRKLSSTYLTWQQVRSFIGMRTNARDLSDKEFAAVLLHELERSATRYAQATTSSSGYCASLSLRRLCDLRELCQEDRTAFLGGKDVRTATRVIKLRLDTDITDMSRLRELALEEFWKGDTWKQIVNRGNFAVEVTKIKPYEK